MLWTLRAVKKEQDPISEHKQPEWAKALRFSAVGLEMVIATMIGFGIGWWLDSKFDTKPWLSLVCMGIGIAAGFKGIYDAAKRAMKEDEETEEKDQ